MKRYLRHLLPLLAIWLLVSPLASAESSTVPSFVAKYQLSMGNMVAGKVETTLKVQPDGSYHYRQHSVPVGLLAAFKSDEITEESSGKISGTTVIPESYLYKREKSKKPRHTNLSFDWKSGRVTDQDSNSQWQLELPPGAQDNFSQQLALTLAMLASRQKQTFQVANKGRLKDYHFSPQEEESIKLEQQQITALKVARSKGDNPTSATLWLDPDRYYIPVRIEKQDKDNLLIMELISLEFPE